MPATPKHLVMIAPSYNLECDSRIIHMINSFCDAGTRVSVVCPPQRSDNEVDLARLLHASATVFAVPLCFPEVECPNLAHYLGYSLSTFPQQLFSQFMSIGLGHKLSEPISKLPRGLRHLSMMLANLWYRKARKILDTAVAEHRYNLYCLSQQLSPSLYRKYREVINLDCYLHFFFIQTLIINKSAGPIDAIFCHDLWSLPVGCLVKELLKVTLLYDTHEIGTCTIEDPANKIVALENEVWMYKLCDRFITVNDSCAKYYTDLCPDLQPLVITNAHRFATQLPVHLSTLKQRLGLPDDVPLSVYVGSLHPLSYMDKFIQAISQCRSNLHLAILGDEGDIDRYKNIAQELDLIDKRVFFLGRVSFKEVHETIHGADLGIIPNIQRHANPWLISSSKLFDYVQSELPFISDWGPEIQKILDQFAIGQTVDFQKEPENIAPLLDDFVQRVRNGDFSEEESRRAKYSLVWPKNVIELIMSDGQPADKISNTATPRRSGSSDIVSTSNAQV